MSVALAAVETPPRRRGRRTETELMAEACMALLAAGMLSVGGDGLAGRKAPRAGLAVTDATLSRVSKIVGVPVGALREAWDKNQDLGFRPPTPDRRQAPAPSINGQRPANLKRYQAKNPEPGKRICSDCDKKLDVRELMVYLNSWGGHRTRGQRVGQCTIRALRVGSA